MIREQKKQILEDLKKKMVFVVGPRQVGKTWLTKDIMKEYKNPLYLNYDNITDRTLIKKMDWLSGVDLIVLDELHKMPKWKNYLKGIFDTRNPNMHMLVTCSAKLETYRQAGDSMAGRFFVHHLLPISLKEMSLTDYKGDLERLIERGGFPEPFLMESKVDADRWRENYIDRLIKEDVLDFKDINKFKAMREVFGILQTKIGSPISYSNIAGDVEIADTTVKKYIDIFEALYIIFIIKPYSKKINRSILKAPKVYFYDSGLVKGDEGAVFENLVANALQKHISGSLDLYGDKKKLMFLRDKDGREVDFVIVDKNDELEQLIEVKLSDRDLAKNLQTFSEKTNIPAVQVVKNLRNGTQVNKLNQILPAQQFLESLIL